MVLLVFLFIETFRATEEVEKQGYSSSPRKRALSRGGTYCLLGWVILALVLRGISRLTLRRISRLAWRGVIAVVIASVSTLQCVSVRGLDGGG